MTYSPYSGEQARSNGLVRSTLLSRSRKGCCAVRRKIASRRLSSFLGISKGEGTRPFDLARRLVYMAHALLLGGLFLVLYFVACRPRKYTSCYTNLLDPECNKWWRCSNSKEKKARKFIFIVYSLSEANNV